MLSVRRQHSSGRATFVLRGRTIRIVAFCSNLSFVMTSLGMARAELRREAMPAPSCAQFYSHETGPIQIRELGTNQPDAVNPIGPITRVHVTLVTAKDEIRFVQLANERQPIASAVVTGVNADVSFHIRNARVIGYSPLRPLQPHTYPVVELEVRSWTALKPGAHITGPRAC